jgi:hypothetical protein
MADELKPVRKTLSLKRKPTNVDVEIYRVDQKKPATTPAERAKEKQARKVKLATLMAKAEGGNPKSYYDALKNIDDLEVQELLLEDRFARYAETPAVGANPDVQAKLDQTNKNARERAQAKLESEREFYERQTGALISNYEDTANLITPETVISGKIKAVGLSNEFNALLEKKRRYGNSPQHIMEGAFTREELTLFSELDRQEFRLNLIGTPVAAGATHLDFGNEGGQDEDGPVEVDVFTEVNAAYDLKDRSTPAEQLLAIFKSASNAGRDGSYDIIPIDRNFVDGIEDEYSISLMQAKVPEYADKVSPALKGLTSAQQQAEVLGLKGDKYDIDQLYDALADQYLDQTKLGQVDSKEQDVIRRAIAGQLQRTLPANFKGIRAQNAAIIERNKRVDPELYENAIANYTAFPAPSELIEAINSVDLRNQVSKYLKPNRSASGLTVKGVVPDVMSSLLGVGVVDVTYNRFDKGDEETQALILKRAGISQIAGLMSKMHSNMEFANGKRAVEEEFESLEEAIQSGKSLDQYQREELARILDVDYVPAGDLSPSYVDDNLTYIDEFAELLERESDVAVLEDEDEESDDEVIEIYEAETKSPSEGGYVPQDGIEQLMDMDDLMTDNSFAMQAVSVDMEASQGVSVGSVNTLAQPGNNLGASAATTDAVEEARVNDPAARANRIASGLAGYKAANPDIKISDTKQGSKEWLNDRIFKATASDASSFTGGDKAQETFARNKAKIATGITKQGYTSPDMQRGNDLEPLIRQQYEAETGFDIAEVSQMTNPAFPGAASLDGILTKDGKPLKKGVELKAPKDFTPQDTGRKKTFTNKYNDQVQMQMHIANLDQMDLVEGVVDPETNKLNLRTTTFDKSEKWAEENRDKIQRAQDSLEANKGLTKQEVQARIDNGDKFLAGEGVAPPTPGNYTQTNAAPSKEELAEAVKAGNLGAAEVIANDNSGKFDKKQTAGTSPAKRGKKSAGKAANDSSGGGGSGGDDDESAPEGQPDSDSGPAGAGGGPRRPKAGKGKPSGKTPVQALWQAWGQVDDFAQDTHALARDYLGSALDYGLDPGKMLGQTRGQQATGMTESAAIANSQKLADLGAQRQLGDWSQSTALITGSLGVIDDRMLEQYKDDPNGMLAAIRKTGKDRNMDDPTIARIARMAGLQQAGGALSMSEPYAGEVTKLANSVDGIGMTEGGNTLAGVGTAAMTASRKGQIVNGANQVIQAGGSVADFLKSEAELDLGVKLPEFKLPELKVPEFKPTIQKAEIPNTANFTPIPLPTPAPSLATPPATAKPATAAEPSFTPIPLPTAAPQQAPTNWGMQTAAPADLGQYNAAPPPQQFKPEVGSNPSTSANKDPIKVDVNLQTSGVQVVISSGGASTEVTKSYQSTSVA